MWMYVLRNSENELWGIFSTLEKATSYAKKRTEKQGKQFISLRPTYDGCWSCYIGHNGIVWEEYSIDRIVWEEYSIDPLLLDPIDGEEVEDN